MVSENDIQAAAEVIKAGGLVAFPTETVYGLGANALDPVAVARIFEVKGRPHFDPLIVHIAGPEDLPPLVKHVPEAAAELIEQFWPGPLSIVLPKRSIVPDIVTAGLPNVAVRCPAHPLAHQLIEKAQRPIAAPSANKFCSVSPTTAQHVVDQLGDQNLDVLDGGPCQVGVESTVISFLQAEPILLRPGGVTAEQIEEVIGSIEIVQGDSQQPNSPGQLARHYAPSTPLRLTDSPPENGKQIGLLTFQEPVDTQGFAAIEVLSERGDLREAAAHLFAAMRRLDALGLDYIIARPFPEVGLGRAIMDRLKRASNR